MQRRWPRTLLALSLGLLISGLSPVRAATTNTAQVHLYCLSIRFDTGTSTGLGSVVYTFQLSSGNSSVEPNGELWPTLSDEPDVATHMSLFTLQDPILVETLTGELYLDVPLVDTDESYIEDIFEVDQEVQATTTGYYLVDGNVDSGEVEAQWKRDAGSGRGTCVLTLTSETYGPYTPFTHAFEIYEYSGPMSYVPSPDPVLAQVELTSVGDPTATFTGPIRFTRNPENRLDSLDIGESFWTNAANQSLKVSVGYADRDPDYPGDYFGYLAFIDGDPNTPIPFFDYDTYYIGIEDPNDADGDGIPDLSDETGAPRLGIEQVGQKLRLTLTGEVGRTYAIQSVTALGLAWPAGTDVTLTEPTYTMEVDLPVEPATFWQAVVK